MDEVRKELMELTHEEVPGYKRVFIFVMIVASLYLAIILINTL